MSNMDFERAYGEWLDRLRRNCSAERLRRLKDGCGHAEHLFLEKVWWPAFGHFNDLHPEYEVFDFKDGARFIDFAYLRPWMRLAIEIDGFGTHWRNIGRWDFFDHAQRQNHLMIDGWKVIRFTYDGIKERTRECQQTLQQLMGRWMGRELSLDGVELVEKEIIRLALRLCRPIKPEDVCAHLGIERKYARKLLRGLLDKGVLRTSGGGPMRIRSYDLALDGMDPLLL